MMINPLIINSFLPSSLSRSLFLFHINVYFSILWRMFYQVFLWVYSRKRPLCISSVTRSHYLASILILLVPGFSALPRWCYFAQVQLLSPPTDSNMSFMKSFWSSLIYKFASLTQKKYRKSAIWKHNYFPLPFRPS